MGADPFIEHLSGTQPHKPMTDKQLALPLFAMASFDAVAIAHTADYPLFQLAFAVLLLVSYALGFMAAFGEEETK